MSCHASGVFAVVLLSAAAFAGDKGGRRLSPGAWGGDHVQLTVSESGATVEFDCGHGTIDEALVFRKHATFDLAGVYVREHGGPIRKDETEVRVPARYKGSADGAALRLEVILEGGETLGPFRVERGKTGRVMKCL